MELLKFNPLHDSIAGIWAKLSVFLAKEAKASWALRKNHIAAQVNVPKNGTARESGSKGEVSGFLSLRYLSHLWVFTSIYLRH
jgi:hypothetical protein